MTDHQLTLARLHGSREAAQQLAAEVPADADYVFIVGRDNRACTGSFTDELVARLTEAPRDHFISFLQCPEHVVEYARESAAMHGVTDRFCEFR